MKKKTQKALKLLIGLFGLVVIVLIAVLLPSNPQLFQGQLETDPAQEPLPGQCVSLTAKTIPPIVYSNASATILIETDPPGWDGNFTFSSSSGTLVDTEGQEGTLLETKERVVNFSGGEVDSVITIQAENSETCIDTIEIQAPTALPCESLTISTYPEPAVANESLEISIDAVPDTWVGSYLLEADSGKLTLAEADPSARGINTGTLVTSGNKIIYNGGSEGENINIRALGEGNERCKAVLTIVSE